MQVRVLPDPPLAHCAKPWYAEVVKKRRVQVLKRVDYDRRHAQALMIRHAIERAKMSDAISLANVLFYRLEHGLAVDRTDISLLNIMVLDGTWQQR